MNFKSRVLWLYLYINKLKLQDWDVRMHEKAPYSIGRGRQVVIQEFEFPTLENVFEALKFGVRVSLVCMLTLTAPRWVIVQFQQEYVGDKLLKSHFITTTFLS